MKKQFYALMIVVGTLLGGSLMADAAEAFDDTIRDLISQQNLNEALTRIEEAENSLDYSRGVPNERKREVAKMYFELAQAHEKLGNWYDANRLYETAFEVHEGTNYSPPEAWFDKIAATRARINLKEKESQMKWKQWIRTLSSDERLMARLTGALILVDRCYKDSRNKAKALFRRNHYMEAMSGIQSVLRPLIDKRGMSQDQFFPFMERVSKNTDVKASLRLYMTMDYGDALEFYCYRIRDAVKSRDYEAMDWG